MNALVGYDDSDDSDNTDVDYTENEQDTTHISNGLFTKLPQPKTRIRNHVEEEDTDTKNLNSNGVHESKKQPVKIRIPSLTDFNDDDEPVSKKPKAEKSSGLFHILPPPKMTPLTAKSFIPNVLKLKKNVPKTSKPTRVKFVISVSEGDDEFNEVDTFDDDTWQKVCGKKKKVTKQVPVQSVPAENKIIELAPEPVKKEDMLDNQAFKELIGTAKRSINIKLIDINEEEILPEKDTWMTKSLTDPAYEPKYEAEDPVNNTCKKKHHITYLVQQAKENEQELKNQWASNRFTRKQTQAKYGF